ncbi:hypothetical protein JOM56_000172 [Amanita muscaria]
MVSPTALLTLALFACSAYGAETSIFVPGFDPQPLSMDYITTDTKGHTVWALYATGDPSNDIVAVPGTLTLVEGSDYMSLGYSYPSLTIHEECSLASDAAVCTVTSSGTTETGTISPITKLPAVIGTPAPSTTPTTSSATSGSAPGASVTSITSTASASNPTKSNSARSAKGAYSSGAAYLLTVVLFYLVAL